MPQLRHRQNDRIQNRYEVRKLLGSGAFGTVYGCRDLEIDVPVAVKELHVLDEEGGERSAALKQFRAEATHLSTLRHPHIVSGHYEPFTGEWRICHVCGLDFPDHTRCPDHNSPLEAVSSRHYLVMEYVAGPDLLQLAANNAGRIGLEAALAYARDIASALAHIHARGLVHRDIKPENIRLRAESDEAVLLDFGIATAGEVEGEKYGTRPQRHTTGGGTVGYAPESVRERQNPDARSDIHAFGMTFYHLLTGKDPTLPGDLHSMRTHTPCDFVPQLPVSLDQLLVECTALDPRSRPQNGAELMVRLENLDNAAAAAPSLGFEPEEEVEPFYFRSGQRVTSVEELAPLLDEFPAEAAQHLYSGELEQWLQRIGERELAGEASACRSRYRGRPKQGLEAFALATGRLVPPLLELSTQELNFGSLPLNGQRTIDLKVQNRGRGHLFGLIRASHPSISTYGEWDGNKAKIPVSFDAHRLRPGKYTGELVLDSSAGERVLPFSARVRGPSWLAPFLTVLIYGALGMVAGALLRTVPFSATDSASETNWLRSMPSWLPVAPLFGCVFGVVLFVWTTLESISRRSLSLWLSMGFFGTMLSIGAGIFGNEILLATDAYLAPHFSSAVGRSAPLGWMIAGATCGLICGSLRRWRDLLSVRVLAVAVGWIAVFVMVFFAIQGGKDQMLRLPLPQQDPQLWLPRLPQ
jgi:serine/threonine protein kinase